MECALAGGNLMGDDDAWIIPSSSRCCMETSSAAPDFCFSFSILFWKLKHLDSTFLPFKGRSFVFHCLDTFCFLLFFFYLKRTVTPATINWGLLVRLCFLLGLLFPISAGSGLCRLATVSSDILYLL